MLPTAYSEPAVRPPVLTEDRAIRTTQGVTAPSSTRRNVKRTATANPCPKGQAGQNQGNQGRPDHLAVAKPRIQEPSRSQFNCLRPGTNIERKQVEVGPHGNDIVPNAVLPNTGPIEDRAYSCQSGRAGLPNPPQALFTSWDPIPSHSLLSAQGNASLPWGCTGPVVKGAGKRIGVMESEQERDLTDMHMGIPEVVQRQIPARLIQQ